MPIVILHTPAQAVGDLAQNAGDFAGQIQSMQAQYPYDALAQHQQQFNQGEQFQQQQTNQAYQHQQQMAAFQANRQDQVNQRQFDQRQQILGQQYGYQGQNQQAVQGMRNDQSNTRLGYQDQWNQAKTGLGYYKADDQSERGYANMDQHAQQAQDRISALADAAAMRMTNNDRGAALQLRQQQEQRMASNQQLQMERQMREHELMQIEQQIHQLPRTDGVNGDLMDKDQKTEIDGQRNVLIQQYQGKAREYTNFMTSTLHPDAGGGSDGQGDPFSGYQTPGIDQFNLGQNKMQLWQADPQAVQQAGPSMNLSEQQGTGFARNQQDPTNDDNSQAAAQWVAQAKAAGMGLEQIKQGLAEQFGISE